MKEKIIEVIKMDVSEQEYVKHLTQFKKELSEERFDLFLSAVIGTLS